MNNTTATHFSITIMVSILLLTMNTSMAKENEGFLARPIAWLRDSFDQFRTTRTKVLTEIPKERLAFKAAQVNGALGAQLTLEQRAILIKNLTYFKMLAQKAQHVPEAQAIMHALIAPEQPGKQHEQYKGALTYVEQYADEADKLFLQSQLGQESLSLLLMHAPYKRQMVTYAQRMNAQEREGAPIFAQANYWKQTLKRIRIEFRKIENDPKAIKALQALEQDPQLIAGQQKIATLEQKLAQKAEDPELQKVLPLLEAKDKELQTKLLKKIQQKGLTKTQKEQYHKEILAEFEQFLGQHPIAKEYIDVMKEMMITQEEVQQRVKKITAEHPEIARFAQLMQADQQAVEEYNARVTAIQALPKNLEHAVQQHNNKQWCTEMTRWFDACIYAIEHNTNPEDHILSRELEMNAQQGEWHQIVQGWKDMQAYIAYKALNNKNAEFYAHEYLDKQYARLHKTEADMRRQTEEKIADLLNIPANTQEALDTLGMTDIKAEELTAAHKTQIKKAYYQKSRECHSDKNQQNTKAADDKQAKINKAYEQLNNLLDNRAPELTQEQKQEYRSLQEELTYPKAVLRMEHKEAQHNIDMIEEPLKHEEILERKIRENTVFNRYYANAIMRALKSDHEMQKVDYFARPSTALTVYKSHV